MKIKTKLRLAFGLLFIIVLSFGGVSLYYMNKMASSSKNILKDNYESLNYLGKMRKILDDKQMLIMTVKNFIASKIRKIMNTSYFLCNIRIDKIVEEDPFIISTCCKSSGAICNRLWEFRPTKNLGFFSL
ncbi:MCP four helix bundle domain-containing protein [Pedobacter nyackensis]|uniref:Four helix bundle sensory module for signal transduction n=1 Tax=Pedobacter nyackensis TaxID=475255 RepID=A0A1W2A8Y2_9SPHI|nr:MCP four helix bundle domain-containing protein [Pedobacter nyackensis]SMC56728.1 Four helix bundle sensory module for signal transduction [Pedobacter nyackensis]